MAVTPAADVHQAARSSVRPFSRTVRRTSQKQVELSQSESGALAIFSKLCGSSVIRSEDHSKFP
jgi:hypothetical protein